ncbi:ABC transporter substrate-binding protein [Bifidobacterium tsurumiense]|nr:zinc ABC transporter substrate-binding protein [Bifidobacterium tsurumiense]MSS12907.1 ABC transporter substrate-binding protein [Bifidobacterium tsurumiense]
MQRVHNIVSVVAGIAALGLLLSGCGTGSTNNSSQAAIRVSSSINQWGSVAQSLGGSHVEVTNILSNTSVEAHDYEPTTADVSAISAADIIVVNGAGYDSWAQHAAESTKATVVNAAQVAGIKDGSNPHIWFSAAVRKAFAKALSDAYAQKDPQHSAEYSKNFEQWESAEQDLQSQIDTAKSTTEGKTYVATESVGWYLADDLGMKDGTDSGYAQAMSNESEPSASDILAMQNTLSSGDAALLIVNSQESNSVSERIAATAKEHNIPIVELSEQMPQQYSDLHEWIGALVKAFAAA